HDALPILSTTVELRAEGSLLVSEPVENILQVSLNRPDRLNALDQDLFDRLTVVLDAVAGAPDSRAGADRHRRRVLLGLRSRRARRDPVDGTAGVAAQPGRLGGDRAACRGPAGAGDRRDRRPGGGCRDVTGAGGGSARRHGKGDVGRRVRADRALRRRPRPVLDPARSEERRVGKEWRAGWGLW